MEDDPSLSCREAARLLSFAHERELSADESAMLRHHLDDCDDCRHYDEQLRFLREAARRYRQ